jgi:hypothetical protein
MEVTESSATISSCGLYRYVLQRRWGAGTHCLFVGLNPSTAGVSTDDATTRKCMRLASSWGFSGMTIANLFAVRCRHPQILSTHRDPIGPENDRFLLPTIEQAHTVVAMWGNHGLKSYGLSERRDQCILSLRNDWQCVGITQQGAPRHPLYVTNRSRLMKFPGGLRESTKRRRLSAYT